MKFEIEIFWEPSNIIEVEAENEEEAQQKALEEVGQPEPTEIRVTEVEE